MAQPEKVTAPDEDLIPEDRGHVSTSRRFQGIHEPLPSVEDRGHRGTGVRGFVTPAPFKDRKSSYPSFVPNHH